MGKYKVLSPIKHDGKFATVGEVVDLPDDVGTYLVKSGSVKKSGSAASVDNSAE